MLISISILSLLTVDGGNAPVEGNAKPVVERAPEACAVESHTGEADAAASCLAIGCCYYDSSNDECNSAIGNNMCAGGQTGETMCIGHNHNEEVCNLSKTCWVPNPRHRRPTRLFCTCTHSLSWQLGAAHIIQNAHLRWARVFVHAHWSGMRSGCQGGTRSAIMRGPGASIAQMQWKGRSVQRHRSAKMED